MRSRSICIKLSVSSSDTGALNVVQLEALVKSVPFYEWIESRGSTVVARKAGDCELKILKNVFYSLLFFKVSEFVKLL